jgi:hypothetical protein
MTSAAGTAAVVRSIARYEGLPASGRWQRARPYGWKLVSGGSGLLYSRLPNVSEHRLVRDLADVEHAAEAAVVVLQAVRPRGPIKRT